MYRCKDFTTTHRIRKELSIYNRMSGGLKPRHSRYKHQNGRRSEIKTQPIQRYSSMSGGLKPRHSRYKHHKAAGVSNQDTADTVEVRGQGNPNDGSLTEDTKTDCGHK